METAETPSVVVNGVGLLALDIKEMAQENDIPHVENTPLAQILYKSAEIETPIPGSLYKAVTEILAYVYRAKNVLSR